MNPKNIKLYNCNGEYYIKDQYRKDTYFDYEDAYNYFDVDVNEILLLKQSDNEYFIRYSDLSKMGIVPLQLKIKNVYGQLDNRVLFIENDNNQELFKNLENKIIWNMMK